MRHQSPPDHYELLEAFEDEREHFVLLPSIPSASNWRIEGRQGPVTGRCTRTILRHFLLPPSQFVGKRVLDIGCGLTTLHADLASIGFLPKYSAVVDGCADVIAHQKNANPGVDAIQSLATNLPFASGRFDVVISNFCMPAWAHSEGEVKDFFHEARRVLRRGGVLAVNPMTIYTDTDIDASQKMQTAIDDQWRSFDDPTVWRRLDVACSYKDRYTAVAIKQ